MIESSIKRLSTRFKVDAKIVILRLLFVFSMFIYAFNIYIGGFNFKYVILFGAIILNAIILFSQTYFKPISSFKYFFQLKQILSLILILFLISCYLLVVNGGMSIFDNGLSKFWVEDYIYLIIPIVYVFFIVNLEKHNNYGFYFTSIEIIYCIYFFYLFGVRAISFDAISKISFIDSYSPFESVIPNAMIFVTLYFLYFKKWWRFLIALILMFLGFKRVEIIMLLLFVIAFCFKNKLSKARVKNVHILLGCVVFTISSFLVLKVADTTFQKEFYNQFGISLYKFSSSRSEIIGSVVNSSLYIDYGLGSTNYYLMKYIYVGTDASNAFLHSDLAKIYLECGLIGSIAYSFFYFRLCKNSNLMSIIVVALLFIHSLLTHNLTMIIQKITFYLFLFAIENECSKGGLTKCVF